MTFLDFFAGIGTIRIGFEQAGWICNGHVEWDKFAQASYNAMHDTKDGEFNGWDIREVRADELPQSDLWAFGAPCQDFSIAGKRKGMDGERSSLVNEIFRLVEETPEENRPTWLLYENVKGMLSSNGGWDFLGILLEMDRVGYDVEWQLLNSKHFGVPQNRERVFTLGHLRGRGGRKVFPITGQSAQSDTGITHEPKFQVVGLDKTLDNPRVIEVANCLTAREDRGISNRRSEGAMICYPMTIDQKYVDGISDDYSFAKRKAQAMLNEKGELSERFNPYNSQEIDEVSPTLTANCDRSTNSSTVLMKQPNFRIRKLTPRECWRLQGIPDHYFYKASAVNSDRQLYKQAGNACTVNVMYEIAKAMAQQWGNLK